jgi:hypothetical protein
MPGPAWTKTDKNSYPVNPVHPVITSIFLPLWGPWRLGLRGSAALPARFSHSYEPFCRKSMEIPLHQQFTSPNGPFAINPNQP